MRTCSLARTQVLQSAVGALALPLQHFVFEREPIPPIGSDSVSGHMPRAQQRPRALTADAEDGADIARAQLRGSLLVQFCQHVAAGRALLAPSGEVLDHLLALHAASAGEAVAGHMTVRQP